MDGSEHLIGQKEGQREAYEGIAKINFWTSALSVLGCLVILGIFVAFPHLRKFFSRLVVYLTVSDFWLCMCNLIGHVDNPSSTKCLVQAVVVTYFGLSSIIWTVIIAYALHQTICRQNVNLEARCEGYFHMIGWGVPFIALVFVAVFSSFGEAGFWCWVPNTPVGVLMRLAVFYFPLWFGVAYNFWVYRKVRRLLKRMLERYKADGGDCEIQQETMNAFEYEQSLARRYQSVQMLLSLPLVLAFCWFFSSIRRIIEIFMPGFSFSVLDYLCVSTASLQGALNAIIYGMNPAVREAMSAKFFRGKEALKGAGQKLRGQRNAERFAELQESTELESSCPQASTIGKITYDLRSMDLDNRDDAWVFDQEPSTSARSAAASSSRSSAAPSHTSVKADAAPMAPPDFEDPPLAPDVQSPLGPDFRGPEQTYSAGSTVKSE